MVNGPTQAGLGGPSWTGDEWATGATKLGIPARPAQRRARLGDTKEPPFKAKPTVTVVGGRCFGSEEPVLRTRAFQLAAYSEADVLAVHFDGDGPSALFLDADPWVNVWDQVVGDAILECLMDGAAC